MAFFTASRALPLTAVLAVAVLAGCKDKKDDVQPGLEIPAIPASYIPSLPTGATARLLVINHDFRFYKVGTVLDPDAEETTPLQARLLEQAQAVFVDGGAQADAGAVSLNGVVLDKSAENVYFKSSDSFYFRQGFTWKVDGAGNVGPFTYTNSSPMPAYTGNIPGTINKNLNLNIPLGGSNISGADSTIITIRSASNVIVRRIANPYLINGVSQTSYVLRPADLQELSASAAGTNATSISVTVFRKNFGLNAALNGASDLVTLNGRTYAIVREAIVTVPVAVVEQ